MSNSERRPPSPAMLDALAAANQPQVVDTAAIETHQAGGHGDEVVVDGLQDTQLPELLEVPELPLVPVEYATEITTEAVLQPQPAPPLERVRQQNLDPPEQETFLTNALRVLAQAITAFEETLTRVADRLSTASATSLTTEQAQLFDQNNLGEDWDTELNNLRLAAQSQDLSQFTETLADFVQAVLTQEVPGQPAQDRPPVNEATLNRFIRVFLLAVRAAATPTELPIKVQAANAPEPVAPVAAENTATQPAAQPQKRSLLGTLGEWWSSAPWTNSASKKEALPVTATLNLTPSPAQEPAVTSTAHEAPVRPALSVAEPAAITAPGTQAEVVAAAQQVTAVTSTELTTDSVATATTATTHPAAENGQQPTESATHLEFAADGQEEVRHKTIESSENKEKLLAELEEELIEHAEILSQELLGRIEAGKPTGRKDENPEALEITEEDQERVINLIFNPLTEYLEVLQEPPRNLDPKKDEPFALISHLIMMLINARIPVRITFKDDPNQNIPDDDEIYQASASAVGNIERTIINGSENIADASEIKQARMAIEGNLKFMLTGQYKIVFHKMATAKPQSEEPSILEFEG